ncbi:MAG: hypothetical protein K0B87_01740 [Candidatus Syntrophosphaera sp.]|nr:hypothetical protein [Candidatus Syntrophosphaera sp.]
MTEIQDKYRERWQDRRKKSYNWKKLLIMILILVALIILINQLNRIGTMQAAPDAEYIEPENAEQPSGEMEIYETPAEGDTR